MLSGAASTSAQQIVCGPPSGARQHAALRVGERADDGARQQLEVGHADAADALRGDERQHRDETAAGRDPEAQRRPLARTQHGEHGGPGREQRDHDRAVGGVDVAQRERGEQREADDDAEHHDRQRPPLRATRPRRPPQAQQDRREDRRHRGTSERDEHRVEVGDREPRRGQREREQRDAERRQREPAQLLAPDGCCYRREGDNVTRTLHDLE
jgi:hypothetical protein